MPVAEHCRSMEKVAVAHEFTFGCGVILTQSKLAAFIRMSRINRSVNKVKNRSEDFFSVNSKVLMGEIASG